MPHVRCCSVTESSLSWKRRHKQLQKVLPLLKCSEYGEYLSLVASHSNTVGAMQNTLVPTRAGKGKSFCWTGECSAAALRLDAGGSRSATHSWQYLLGTVDRAPFAHRTVYYDAIISIVRRNEVSFAGALRVALAKCICLLYSGT